MPFISNCGKRPKGAPKPPNGAGIQRTSRWLDYSLINKDLLLLSEADCYCQEAKGKFVWDTASNNPHFFPQERAFAAHIYFHTPLTIRGDGE